MNFKFYDILSQLIPGFLVYFLGLRLLDLPFEFIPIVPATAVAFLIGYFINAISSWLEGIYYWSWGGKPSSMLLKGIKIWKVNFYSKDKVRTLLMNDATKSDANEDELFEIAMRCANQEKNDRTHDFNANFAFSRVILTTTIVLGIFIVIKYHDLYWVWIMVLITNFVAWLRCKQRAGYYAREVLNTYIRFKDCK